MGKKVSPGRLFRLAMAEEIPLQVVGTINAYSALLAEKAGFRAIYLSGAGVANASLALPDLGMTTLGDVLEDARRITAASTLPLIVDADTGWGHPLMISRAIRDLIRIGAAGAHLEDQVAAKRCGHRAGKMLVASEEMEDRIKAAVDARSDQEFVIIARTDALAVEGLKATIERGCRYGRAGADILFLEAATSLKDYRRFSAEVKIPILANMTEFGVTPLFDARELGESGVRVVLYPLSAFRAMSAAAERVYRTIRAEGSQRGVVSGMQSRAELYGILGYSDYERRLDELFEKGKKP
ncbi:MAG TPA: methylisocitrate lyase [Geobacteraceae bacterium]|nr:methylisocitrate lyase [Geobacteraceae bacterium]